MFVPNRSAEHVSGEAAACCVRIPASDWLRVHSVLTKPLRGGLLDLTIFFSKASLKGWIGNIIEYQRVSKENFAIFGHFWPFSAPKMAEIRIVWF